VTSDHQLFAIQIEDIIHSLKTTTVDIPQQARLNRLRAVQDQISRLCQALMASLPRDVVSK